MPNTILYGVGNAVLRDFVDESKIVALSKLKNLNVEVTGDEEKVYAGDDPYAFASFPKDKAITITADTATFDLKAMNATQGGTKTTGSVTFTEVESYTIPADGIVKLSYEPDAGTVQVDGFTEGEISSLTAGKFAVDTVDTDEVHFAVADAGKEVDIVYERTSAVKTETISILKDSMAKPFKFIHRIPVYDNNNNIVAQAQLTVYKCKANNAFNFNLQQQTAFAPRIEFEAQDPKRPDKKLWDFSIETIA